MSKKMQSKKPGKKNAPRKLSLSRLIIIILVVAIALAFMLFSIYIPKSKKLSVGSSPSISKSSPSFRKDGTLSVFLSRNSSPILLDIEVVDKEEDRMRGLMDRYNLPETAGMLFIFPDEEPRSFWMKNTFISLDIIYINTKKEIVSIQKYTQPKSTYSIPSEKPAMYVLEVNAGFTDKNGIAPGNKIDFSY
jgi:uncharacterized membrane protein (UPF0127 family)